MQGGNKAMVVNIREDEARTIGDDGQRDEVLAVQRLGQQLRDDNAKRAYLRLNLSGELRILNYSVARTKDALNRLLAERFYTAEEASDVLNVPLRAVYAMAARGPMQFPEGPGWRKSAGLGSVRFFGRSWFVRSEVDRLSEQRWLDLDSN